MRPACPSRCTGTCSRRPWSCRWRCSGTAPGYFLVGRNLRQQVSLLPYVAIAYTTSAALLVPAVAVAGEPFGGFPIRTWALFVVMALVPHILGHTVFNYLLRHLEATVV